MPEIGTILYRGPSEFDGSPIVVIATHKTANRKTGDMIQTWIIRARIHPVRAVAIGADVGVCGDCPSRRHHDTAAAARNVARTEFAQNDPNGAKMNPNAQPGVGMCYVNVGQAPRSVYEAFRAGSYTTDPTELYELLAGGKRLRIGSYGDPAAVPLSVWTALASRARGWTGYTHAWRHCDAGFAGLLMASCETAADERRAQLSGWRTFRTVDRVEDAAGAILCPASDEAGKKTDCDRCGLCSGTRRGARKHIKSIRIVAHGKVATARITRLTIGGR